MTSHLSLLVICIVAAIGNVNLRQPPPPAENQPARAGEVKQEDVKPAVGLERVLRGHRASVTAVAYSPDNRYLASLGDFAHIVRIWDVKTGNEVKQLTGKGNGCVQVMFSPDGGKILSRSFDSVFLWDVASWNQVESLNSILMGGMGFSATQGPLTAAGNLAPQPLGPLSIAVKQLATGKVLSKLDWNSDKMPRLTFSQDCAVALAIQHREIPVPGQPGAKTLGADPTVRLVELASGKELLRLDGPESVHLQVAIAPDRSRALLGGDGGNLWLFDLNTGKEIRRFQGHTGSVRAVTFSPDGRRVLSGSDDKTMRLWDVQTGKQLELFQAPGMTTVSCIAFSPDGRRAVSGSYDSAVRLWKLPE